MTDTNHAFSVKEWATSMIPTAREKYGFSPSTTIRFIYQSENSTFLVENPSEGIKYILRICKKGYHTKQETESELQLIRCIRDNSDLCVASPVPGVNGEYVQVLQTPDGQDVFCEVFEFVEGKDPSQKEPKELGGFFETLGSLSARMHNVIEKTGISEKLCRPLWNYETLIGENAILGDWRKCPNFTQEERKILAIAADIIRRRLDAYEKNSKNYGVVHSDMRLANLLEKPDGEYCIIDFDDSGFCWFLNDYGSAFSFIEDDPAVPMLSERWIKGYSEYRTLSERDLAELDTFILIRRLLLQGFLVTHPESEAITDGIHIDYAQGTVHLGRKYIKTHG